MTFIASRTVVSDGINITSLVVIASAESGADNNGWIEGDVNLEVDFMSQDRVYLSDRMPFVVLLFTDWPGPVEREMGDLELEFMTTRWVPCANIPKASRRVEDDDRIWSGFFPDKSPMLLDSEIGGRDGGLTRDKPYRHLARFRCVDYSFDFWILWLFFFRKCMSSCSKGQKGVDVCVL